MSRSDLDFGERPLPFGESSNGFLFDVYQQFAPTMITTNVRQLPVPPGANFGGDPRQGYGADANRSASGSGYLSNSRPGSSSEKLPPVSHLLTSGSPTASNMSAYSAHSRSPSHGYSMQSRSPYTTSGYDATQYPTGYHTTQPSASGAYGGPNGINAPLRAISESWYPPDSQSYEGLHPLHGYADPNGESPGQRPVVKLIGERVFPGEGLCYVYDDGSHVRKVIDGEAVNAQWGITKAGKPRKRLAIACITCREKKIKCDPSEPKCVQCDKAGRECRFQTARAHRRH